MKKINSICFTIAWNITCFATEPVDYSGKTVDNQDFSGKNLEGSNFKGSKLINVNFSDAILINANFEGAYFQQGKNLGSLKRNRIFLMDEPATNLGTTNLQHLFRRGSSEVAAGLGFRGFNSPSSLPTPQLNQNSNLFNEREQNLNQLTNEIFGSTVTPDRPEVQPSEEVRSRITTVTQARGRLGRRDGYPWRPSRNGGSSRSLQNSSEHDGSVEMDRASEERSIGPITISHGNSGLQSLPRPLSTTPGFQRALAQMESQSSGTVGEQSDNEVSISPQDLPVPRDNHELASSRNSLPFAAEVQEDQAAVLGGRHPSNGPSSQNRNLLQSQDRSNSNHSNEERSVFLRETDEILNNPAALEVLRNVNFTDFYLTGANLMSFNLQHTNLSNNNLHRNDLRGATLSTNLTLPRYNPPLDDLFNAWNPSSTNRENARHVTNEPHTTINKTKGQLNRANLMGANLKNATLENIELNHANLEGADLTNTNLKGAGLEEANLINVTWGNTRLEGANLTGAYIMQDTQFNPKKSNTYFKLWTIGQKKYDTNQPINPEIEATVKILNNLIFSGANIFKEVSSEKLKEFFNNRDESISIDLRYVDFSNKDLRGINLKGVNLAGANLSRSILTGNDLSGVNLQGANLTNTWLDCALLKRTKLWKSDLSNAELSGADLTGSCLQEANLTEANLTGSNLTGTNLRKANFSRANLGSANLSVALDIYANFEDAYLGDIIAHHQVWNSYLMPEKN